MVILQHLYQGDELITELRTHPANTKHLYNICTTSAQRLRRWSNIIQMLYKCFVFAGQYVVWTSQQRSVSRVCNKQRHFVYFAAVDFDLCVHSNSLVISTLFLENLPSFITNYEKAAETTFKSVTYDLSATIRCLRHRELLLMVPLVFYCGISGTFNIAEFTEVSVNFLYLLISLPTLVILTWLYICDVCVCVFEALTQLNE